MEAFEIERLIRSLGISSTYRGYHYLRYSLDLCLYDETYILSVSKLLYPQIAHVFYTTSCSVERDMRTIINVCWERGGRNYLQHIALYPLSKRPSVGEFLNILIYYLKCS